MLFKCQNSFLTGPCLLLVPLVLGGWRLPGISPVPESAGEFLNRCFDPGHGKLKLKRWELALTDEGFLRLRKYLRNDKQEYFSFRLDRFTGMEYLGTTSSGELRLHTRGDDVIVQTFQDPAGDVDSMSSTMAIPVKDVRAEDLNNLQAELYRMQKQVKLAGH